MSFSYIGSFKPKLAALVNRRNSSHFEENIDPNITPNTITTSTETTNTVFLVSDTAESGIDALTGPKLALYAANKLAATNIATILNPTANRIALVSITFTKTPLYPITTTAATATHFIRPDNLSGRETFSKLNGGNEPVVIKK